MPRSYSAIFAFATTLLAGNASAHTTGVSQSRFTVGADGTVDAEIVFAVTELASAVALDTNHDGVVTREEIEAARPDLERLVLDGVEVKANGKSCPAAFRDAEVTEADGLVIDARFICPVGARSIEATLFLLSELRPGHRHVALIVAGAQSSQKLLNGTSRSVTLELDRPASGNGPRSTGGRRDALVGLTAGFAIAMAALFAWRWRRGRKAP